MVGAWLGPQPAEPRRAKWPLLGRALGEEHTWEKGAVHLARAAGEPERWRGTVQENGSSVWQSSRESALRSLPGLRFCGTWKHLMEQKVSDSSE